MRRIKYVFAGALIGLFSVPLFADEPGSSKQLDEILTELRELRKLVEANKPLPPAPPQPIRGTVDVGDAPLMGDQHAPLTIAEFTDYQCPFCERFYKETFPEIKKTFIDSGMARFYVMNFPLTEIHANAMSAAEAARCAKDQGKFWQFHEHLQTSREHLDLESVIQFAADQGVNIPVFRECVTSKKYQNEIQQTLRMAQTKGTQGTPTFFVGKSTPEGVDGEIIVGAVPFETFEKSLQKFASDGDSIP